MNQQNPPSYDALYSQPSQPHPIHVQPQPNVVLQVPQQQIIVAHHPNMMDITPAVVLCQNCQHSVMTRTEAKPALRTHLWAVCLFAFGLWPCCLVPYCMPSCNNIDHYCSKCNAYIGSYTG